MLSIYACNITSPTSWMQTEWAKWRRMIGTNYIILVIEKRFQAKINTSKGFGKHSNANEYKISPGMDSLYNENYETPYLVDEICTLASAYILSAIKRCYIQQHIRGLQRAWIDWCNMKYLNFRLCVSKISSMACHTVDARLIYGYYHLCVVYSAWIAPFSNSLPAALFTDNEDVCKPSAALCSENSRSNWVICFSVKGIVKFQRTRFFSVPCFVDGKPTQNASSEEESSVWIYSQQHSFWHTVF